MASRYPSEYAIAREMEETGFDRLACIRRIQQRANMRRPVSRTPRGEPLFFLRPGEQV